MTVAIIIDVCLAYTKNGSRPVEKKNNKTSPLVGDELTVTSRTLARLVVIEENVFVVTCALSDVVAEVETELVTTEVVATYTQTPQ